MIRNNILCTGRVMHKNFNAERKSLFIVLGVFTPKYVAVSGNPEDRFNHDFPGFMMEGDKAVEANDMFEVNDYISIEGHINTEEYMRPMGHGNYRKEWRTLLIADEIYLDGSHSGFNNVSLAGEVIHTYKNENSNNSLYIVTLKMDKDKGEYPDRANFVYFDRELELEPKIGDYISVNGIIQTKKDVDDNGNARYLTSIIARYLSIERA